AIVDELGNFEEVGVSGDDPPIRLQAQVPQKGDFGEEDFRHSPAVRGGVEVKDSDTAQRGGKSLEFGDAFGTGTALIATDRSDAHMNLFKHGEVSSSRGHQVRLEVSRPILAPSVSATGLLRSTFRRRCAGRGAECMIPPEDNTLTEVGVAGTTCNPPFLA